MKVKSDHRSKFSHLSNWKEESWKITRLQRDLNPWLPRYRCDARPTELWSHTSWVMLICWVHIFACSEMMWNKYEIHMVLQLLMKVKSDHRSKFSNLSDWKKEAWKIEEVTGSNPVEALIFFRLLPFNCLNWKIYCDDHSSLSLIVFWFDSFLLIWRKSFLSFFSMSILSI